MEDTIWTVVEQDDGVSTIYEVPRRTAAGGYRKGGYGSREEAEAACREANARRLREVVEEASVLAEALARPVMTGAEWTCWQPATTAGTRP